MLLKKRRLEITLQKLRPMESRTPRLEQYPTPATIAADILWEAVSAGDICDKTVADLGCGNGIFCLGAKLLGAKRSVGIDIDPLAIKVARENAEALFLEVELTEGGVSAFSGEFDTVVQNPPFGSQNLHADREFIKKSIELAPRVYSLHNECTEPFVADMVRSLGGRCEPIKRYKFEIPYAFEFHRKASETIPVVLMRFER